MPQSKYFPNLENGIDVADVDVIEDAFSGVETDVNNILNTKQDILSFDTTPTEGSTNPVISGGIKSALDLKADKTETYTKTEVDDKDNAIKSDIEALKQKSIPHTTASDYPLTVTDHLEGESVINYQVYGNSVQDGTPTPDNPVEIQSVGDLVTDETSEYYGKYDVPVVTNGKNLLPYPYVQTTRTVNGITFTDNGDGSITANGTATATAAFTLVGNSLWSGDMPFSAGTYTISGCPSGGGGTSYRITAYGKLSEGADRKLYLYCYGDAVSKTIEACRLNITITISKGITVSNLVFKPQIERGSAATSYEQGISETKHIYLNEPLRKVGDYADYVDFQSQKTIRQVEVLDDTGTKTIAESFGILATPTEEPISVPELTAPNSAVMNVSSGTAIQPSQIDLTYYQDINKIITNLTNAVLAQGGNV